MIAVGKAYTDKPNKSVGHVGAVFWPGAAWQNVDWNTELRLLSSPNDAPVLIIHGF